MLNQDNLKTIREIVQEFFKMMTIEAQAEISLQEGETVFIAIESPEPQILIGENGQTLMEIQQILKTILRRKIPEQFYIDVDVNGYRQAKNDYLRKMAQSLADEVALSGQEKYLPPMPAYERRIVHTELSKRTDVVSESRGEEPERRIIIKIASPK